MLFTIPAVISCVASALALFVGVATIALSVGPGWREVRWFGVAVICASVYGVCALESTLDVMPTVRPFFGRLGGASASLLVASWFVYFGVTEKAAMARWERVVIVATAIVGIAWLVPGLCRTSEVFTRTVPWLGVSYTTTRPTAIGRMTYALLFSATCVLAARGFRAWRRGQPGALAIFIGISVQLVAGVNDALAASGKLATPYALDIGQFVVVVAVGTTLISRFIADAREHERSAAALRKAQGELVRRERLAALGELSAVVAHEVRNPLSVVFNAVSSLRKQPLSRDATLLVDIVDEEAHRLKRVVSELLEFAQPRSLALETVSLRQLVEGAVDAARAGVDASLVVVDIAPDLPDVTADEQLLRQALINLIANALDAPGRTAPVRVTVVGHGPPIAQIDFRVYDDGAGISDEVAQRMFTPFFTTRASGTGLGLAIVKRIAEAHGGTVSWQRGGGGHGDRGVTFTLRIPVEPAQR